MSAPGGSRLTPHESVKVPERADEIARDLSAGVDASGNGALVCALSRIRNVEQCNVSEAVPREAVDHIAPINVGPVTVPGIIDAETNTFVQAIPSGPAAHSVAAFAKNNHIFVPIGAPNPKAPVNSNACVKFGLPESNGCIAVYAH